MREIRSALALCGCRSTLTAWDERTTSDFAMYARMIEQLRNGTRNTAAIDRVGVEISDDDKRSVARQTTASTLIVYQVSRL